jgi:hypothetical protein
MLEEVVEEVIQRVILVQEELEVVEMQLQMHLLHLIFQDLQEQLIEVVVVVVELLEEIHNIYLQEMAEVV